jgi:8-oxo-dGTP pyrophosphatase MutT (NUDIX family)
VYNAVVESVEYLGEQDVVAISTSTRTLFAEGLYSHNSNSYGPFLPRPARTFTEGAFGPFSPILPVPLDAPAVEDGQPDPRLWEYPVGWNLPVGQPGTEGLKLVDFATLKTLSDTYSVARSCIDRRKYEVCGLDWDIVPTHEASKAYQGDRKAMRDFGERVAKAKRFFRHPDPDYFTFSDFLSAMLEEVFVYDALAIVMRPKWGKGVGAGLLGSDLDCLELISGPTIRPLVGLHGEVPRPPAPAYQQYLYGVPRSDYMTMITQRDIDEAGIGGSELQNFRTDQLMYLRTTPRRETPYGFSLTEKAIIPILTGLQKQAFQYDYFREGTVPAVYISPGDASITPNQIRELQDALNAIAGDVAFHHKIIVLPPGSKTMPQRDAQLADQFDEIVMTEVAMVYDVDPMSLGIVPKVATSVSPFAAKEMAQASASVHQRTSTKPLLSFITDIFNNILHRVCGQDDMKFTFEGMSETSDAAATTDLVVKQVQYGIRSVDEGRAELELPPWNMPETSGPVVFTQMGPVPFEMAPQLLMQQQQGAGGSGGGAKAGGGNSSGSGKRTRATSTTGRGDQYGGPGVPRHGNLPAPSSTRISSDVPPERKKTPAHDAAEGAMSTGSSKPGGGRVGASKAAAAELEALGRHLRKGRDIRTWKAVNVPGAIVEAIAEDLQKGLSFDEAVGSIPVFGVEWVTGDTLPKARGVTEWPGWKHDLGLVAAYTDLLRRMFSKADGQAGKIRGEYAHSVVSYTPGMFDGMIADHLQEKVAGALEPLAREAWKLGYGSALELIGDRSVSFGSNPDAFVGTEVRHWAETIARTGLKDAARRAEVIARTEVARGVSAGAMQAYADAGISYKHLLLAPDDACEKCVDADEEVIPLHAPFGTGDVAPPFHPQCRCGVAPSGVDVTPPQGHLGKSESERKPDVAFLLIRTRNSEGKRRYLLQKRGEEASHPGTWGLFGGKGHPGETPWETACREAGEETGGLPKDLVPRGVMFTPGDKRDCWTYVCDVAEEFSPGGGVTPWESASWGWFSRDDVSGLELHPKFAETWDVYVGEVLGKSKKRVLVSGQEIYPSDSETGEDDEWPASGGGGEYPHSHDVDGTPVAPGGKPGSEPPRWDGDEAEPYVQMPGGPGGAAGRAPDSPAGGGSCDSTCDDPGHAHSTPIDGNVPDDEDDARQPFVRGRPPNAIGKGRS